MEKEGKDAASSAYFVHVDTDPKATVCSFLPLHRPGWLQIHRGVLASVS